MRSLQLAVLTAATIMLVPRSVLATADFDGNGTVDESDLRLFAASFVSNESEADLDEDHELTYRDFLEFADRVGTDGTYQDTLVAFTYDPFTAIPLYGEAPGFTFTAGGGLIYVVDGVDSLGGARSFSLLDSTGAHYSVELDEQARPTIVTSDALALVYQWQEDGTFDLLVGQMDSAAVEVVRAVSPPPRPSARVVNHDGGLWPSYRIPLTRAQMQNMRKGIYGAMAEIPKVALYTASTVAVAGSAAVAAGGSAVAYGLGANGVTQTVIHGSSLSGFGKAALLSSRMAGHASAAVGLIPEASLSSRWSTTKDALGVAGAFGCAPTRPLRCGHQPPCQRPFIHTRRPDRPLVVPLCIPGPMAQTSAHDGCVCQRRI